MNITQLDTWGNQKDSDPLALILMLRPGVWHKIDSQIWKAMQSICDSSKDGQGDGVFHASGVQFSFGSPNARMRQMWENPRHLGLKTIRVTSLT